MSTGDVIEIILNGETVTALVLLASEKSAILDLCDGSVPFVSDIDELVSARVFTPFAVAA